MNIVFIRLFKYYLLNEYIMNTCPICLQKIKFKKTLPCSHKYCNECIIEWLTKKDDCPVCRCKPNHRYNTRLNNFNKNKGSILNNIKSLIDLYEWTFLTNSEKVNRFDEVIKCIYENKILLKNKKLKKVTMDKIQHLKDNNEFIGFYWSQLIY